MWYSGYDGNSYRVYYATSSDGLVWTKVDNVTANNANCNTTCSGNGMIGLGASGGDSSVAAGGGIVLGSVIKDGGTFRLWYAGFDGANWRIFNATSPDGLTWTKTSNAINAASAPTDVRRSTSSTTRTSSV